MRLNKRVLMGLSVLAFSMLLSCSEDSDMKEKYDTPYAFSTEQLNHLFNKQGYGSRVWSYSSAPKVERVGSAILLQDSKAQLAYLLKSNGKIDTFPKIKGEGVCFFGESGEFIARWNAYGKDAGLTIGDASPLSLLKGETVPVFDANRLYLGRRYKPDGGRERFIISTIAHSKEVYSAEGRLLYLESGDFGLAIIAWSSTEEIFSVTIHRVGEEDSKIAIPYPDEYRIGFAFGFSDYCEKTKLISFVEYGVPSSGLKRDRVWVFDLEKKEYKEPEEVNFSNGHIFAFFFGKDDSSVAELLVPK